MRRHVVAAVALLAGVLLLAGCASAPSRPPPLPTHCVGGAMPANLAAIPMPTPVPEPPSRYGNRSSYQVFGRTYHVLSSARGYDQTGIASWYGQRSQGKLTSNLEHYDLYKYTAASKVLPLPTFVRVTDLSNGRSVIVKVNDRGPFVAHRLIDLSYLAAAKLGMLGTGTALVRVQALSPDRPESLASAVPGAGPLLYVQVGAFAVPANAERVFTRLRAGGIPDVFILSPAVTGGRLYRVRVGPIRDVPQFDRLAARLTALGYPGARLVEP